MPQAPVPEEMNVYQNAEARFEVASQPRSLVLVGQLALVVRIAESASRTH